MRIFFFSVGVAGRMLGGGGGVICIENRDKYP